MADVLTTDEFIDFVSQSGLVDSSWVETYRLRLRTLDPAQTAPDAIARMLVAEKLLTPFQAKQLLKRRFRGFFISGKYKILLFLGHGGMGRVLLCEHLMLQRLVALKLMNLSLDAAPGAIERFLREARATAAMDHPNIARVFDVDRSEQGPYMVMEYIDGINLHELVAEHGQLAIDRAANYIRQAAAGLQHAHEAGLVHRDIKPSNLMLDRSGTIKLLDLGLARFFDTGKNGNVTQQFDAKGVLGTTDFIAPEQAIDSSTADIRADIYSLGCTFYFMLLRKLTVGNGSMIQKLLFHQSRDPEPIRSLRPEVPEGLAAVVEKMFKKNPADRYQTPAELIEALKPWTSEPVAKPPAEEMPNVTPSAFRLGLCTPPATGSGSGAPVASPTPSVRSAQVSMGTSPERRSALDGSRASNRESSLAALLEEELPQFGDNSLLPPQSNLPAARLAGNSQSVASASGVAARGKSGTGVGPGAAARNSTGPAAKKQPGRQRALPAAAPQPAPAGSLWSDRRSRMILLSGLLGGMLALGGISFLFQQFSAARERAALLSNAQQKAAQVVVPQPIVQPQPVAPAMPASGVVLRGGGSTFVKPIMEHWAGIYQKQTGATIEYTAVGSSKGIDGVTSKFLDFGCTDAYMSDKQLAEASGPMLHVPLAMGAVVPTYNVPDETGKQVQLRFTGALLANIYLGKVTKWNDPTIAVNNPGQHLPELDIVVVHRKEGSGTTSIWTDYLSKASAAWKAKVGSGTKVEWPVGIAAEKSDGVADAVSRTPGAIGYVELSFALGNGLQAGEVKNRAGVFVSPSIDGITSAAAGSLHDIPDDLRYSLTDAPGQGSYPIVGTAWAVIYLDQPRGKKDELVKFLRWATSDGQQFVGDLKYGRLPPELVAKIHDALKQVGGVAR
jgi:phosphate ABC transporter phosphate-binding protein